MILKERYDLNFKGKLLLNKREDGRYYTSVKIMNGTNKNVVFFDLPIIAHISATHKCNLNCYYCYAKDNQNKEDMSHQEFKNVLDKCNQNGVLILYWSGGEPFANENFVDLLEYGHNLGFYQKVLSNATLITDEQIDRIKKLNIGFQTSFNGIWENEEGEWLLDKAIINTRKLIEAGINTIVTIIVKEYNEKKIRSILDVCQKNNIMNIRFGYELALGLNEEMNKAEYIQNAYRFNKKFELIKAEYRGKLNISYQSEAKTRENDLFSKRMLLCEAGTSQIYIDNNGDAYPCPLFKSFSEFCGGNVLDGNFRDIWYSQNIHKIRSFSLEETKCSDCNLICGSWCRGLMFSYTGDIKAHPYFCAKRNI